MPESKCFIYGCGTSRKHVGISIFRIPTKDENSRSGSKDRRKFTKSIPQQTVYVCERHFDKHLIENVSSFLNLIGFLVDVLIFRYERLKVNTAYQKLVYISCIKFVRHMEQEIYKYTDLHKEDNLYIDNCSQA
jgi:hypothetical protein